MEIARRTGISLSPMIGSASSEQLIDIQLAAHRQLEELPKAAGVWPSSDGQADERHSLTIDHEPTSDAFEISIPCARILDGPRYAWRGLSLDLSRAFFTSDEIRRVIDLLALYKLNVLHLHRPMLPGWR